MESNTDEMHNALISIIVPIYNVEKYLNTCVESIVAQTYSNLEIILVDDGSPDACPIMCDEWAKKDMRIRVIHKENGGLSDARNVGITQAKGMYIALVDSDDFISQYFIEILFNVLQAQSSDIVILSREGAFLDGNENTLTFATDENDFFSQSLTQREALELFLYQKTPTAAQFHFYRKNLFDEIRYPFGCFYEDLATTYRLYLKANRFAKVDADLYAYRHRDNSIMTQAFNPQKMVMIEITQKLYSDLCAEDLSYQKAAASRCFAAVFSIFRIVPIENKQAQALLWQELTKYRKDVLFDNNENIRDKNRIGAFLCYFGNRVAYFLSRLAFSRLK